jgi:hypothetical protein
VSKALGEDPKTLGEGCPECNTRGRPTGEAVHGEEASRVDELKFSCELAIFIPLLGEAACDGRINISAQIQMVADHMMSTFLEELIIQSLKINLR